MIDTIRLISHNQSIISQFDVSTLKDPVYSSSKHGIISKGYLKRMTISKTDRTITIYGSLPKYFFGDNIQTLTFQQIKEAISKLSDELNIDLTDFNVCRVDLSTNFEMNTKVATYLNYLSEKSCHERKPYKSGIMFTSPARTLLFYDKLKEAKIKDDSKNLLRYELQLKSIWKDKKFSKMKVKDLFNETYFKKLLQYWIDQYKSIKTKQEALDLDALPQMGATDLERTLCCFFLIQNSDSPHNLLRELSKRCGIKESTYYKMTDRVFSNGELYQPTRKYLEELDSKIAEFKENYFETS